MNAVVEVRGRQWRFVRHVRLDAAAGYEIIRTALLDPTVLVTRMCHDLSSTAKRYSGTAGAVIPYSTLMRLCERHFHTMSALRTVTALAAAAKGEHERCRVIVGYPSSGDLLF